MKSIDDDILAGMDKVEHNLKIHEIACSAVREVIDAYFVERQVPKSDVATKSTYFSFALFFCCKTIFDNIRARKDLSEDEKREAVFLVNYNIKCEDVYAE